jgi:hypothetical protein
MVQVSQQPNESGKLRTVEETIVVNDLSDASPYTSAKTPDYTETRQGFQSKSTAPTLTETYGSLVRRKNENGTYDGEKVVRTYTGTARTVDLGEGTILNFKLECVVFYTNGRGTNGTVYIKRTDRKITSSASTAATFADEYITAGSGSGTNPVTNEKLGRVESAPNYNLYIAYSVSIFAISGGAPTFATVAGYARP